jgi:hypothetical protein
MAVDPMSAVDAAWYHMDGPANAATVVGMLLTKLPLDFTDRMMFWVPHPGRQLGMGISILSYCGQVSLAVIADAHLVPDPETIAASFNHEFDRMLKTVVAGGAKAPVEPKRASVPATARKRGARTERGRTISSKRASPARGSRAIAARSPRVGSHSR